MEVTTPGRICLFGEHQDYLGLPVIATAISLRASIKGIRREDDQIIIHMPDIDRTENFSLGDGDYKGSRDYFKSGLNIAKREGLVFSYGFECELKSDIPIQAGTSSSSAIVVSWLHFLSLMADNKTKWSRKKLGELAYMAEVEEFNEPGGMMDQYSTAIGSTVYLESEPKIRVEKINTSLGSFVLGDSMEKKDTLNILSHCRNRRLNIFEKIISLNPSFNIHSSKKLDLSVLTTAEKNLFHHTIKNRDILRNAKNELEKDDLDHEMIGHLLNLQHFILRDYLNVSTKKIELMIEAANKAGAYGCKINGSGGGGCMFAYGPEDTESISDAIRSVGGIAYVVQADEGTKVLI